MANDLAQRMYVNQATPALTPPATSAPIQDQAPSFPPTVAPDIAQRMYGAQAAQDEGGTSAVLPEAAELVPEETTAERMYEASGPAGDSPKVYSDAALGQTFEGFERQARYDQNEDDRQALATGRRETASLMHEMGIPLRDGREVASSLGRWVGRRLEGDALAAAGEQCATALRKEWGDAYERKMGLAQMAFEHAAERLPWLANLVNSGAGNDPVVIRHLANIGLHMTRKSKGAKA